MPEVNKKGKILNITIAIIIILVGVSLRLLPHPPNFIPIAAIALFGGVYFSRKIALFLPLLAMLISDIFLGLYEVKLMAFVYGSFLICVILGFWLKKNKKWYRILGGAIFCSLIFFVVTNIAVWSFTSWYSKDFQGIIQCYLMALPFLRNTLLGDLFYSAVFFGIYEASMVLVRKKFQMNKAILVFSAHENSTCYPSL